MVSFLDLLAEQIKSNSNNNSNNNADNDVFDYCLHCRCTLRRNRTYNGEDPVAQKCTRCELVHYCSRDCQKANFPLHKNYCKAIHRLRTTDDRLSATPSDEVERRLRLASCICDLAYKSTDTISRGKRLYDTALVEYYSSFRLNPGANGALPSLLLLSAILGYDRVCLTLIDACLNCWDESSSMVNDDNLLEWTFGDSNIHFGKETTIGFRFDPEGFRGERTRLRTKIPWDEHWCANNFLLPLMLIELRNHARLKEPTSSDDDSRRHDYQTRKQRHLCESARLCRAIEFANRDRLPVLQSLKVESYLRWDGCATVELLAGNAQRVLESYRTAGTTTYSPASEYSIWERSCYTWWQIVKDWVAFTPGVSDSLDETLSFLNGNSIPVVPEERFYEELPRTSPGPEGVFFFGPERGDVVDPFAEGWETDYFAYLETIQPVGPT